MCLNEDFGQKLHAMVDTKRPLSQSWEFGIMVEQGFCSISVLGHLDL